jgi:hypothetical protein
MSDDRHQQHEAQLTFDAGDTQKGFFFNPQQQHDHAMVPPAGYSTSTTLRQISATVTARHSIQHVDCRSYRPDVDSLAGLASSQLNVTATRNSGSSPP